MRLTTLQKRLQALDTLDLYTRAPLRVPFSAEHIVPRTVSEDPRVRKDLHLVFPTKLSLNVNRCNYKYGDVSLANATEFYETGARGRLIRLRPETIAKSNPQRMFTPGLARGVVARACAHYFFQYGAGTPSRNALFDFETLVEWHMFFPATDAERFRNDKVFAGTQRYNLFVDDPFMLVDWFGNANVA